MLWKKSSFSNCFEARPWHESVIAQDARQVQCSRCNNLFLPTARDVSCTCIMSNNVLAVSLFWRPARAISSTELYSEEVYCWQETSGKRLRSWQRRNLWAQSIGIQQQWLFLLIADVACNTLRFNAIEASLWPKANFETWRAIFNFFFVWKLAENRMLCHILCKNCVSLRSLKGENSRKCIKFYRF